MTESPSPNDPDPASPDDQPAAEIPIDTPSNRPIDNAPTDNAPTDNASSDNHPIRRGSPFAGSALRGDGVEMAGAGAIRLSAVDAAFDPEWGVLRAANWASAWVALCGIACWQMFPGGGVIVSVLGCGLATIGLFSSRAIAATVLLLVHAALFFACYQRLF